MAKTLQEVLQIFGPLDDAGGSDSARERFRRYLRDEVFIPEVLLQYVSASESLTGLQRVRAMQDIINRIGELLGFQVTHGRYHGKNGPVTIDGHWRSNAGHQYLIEVRTGVDTPPDPARMRNFARLLHMAGKLPELHTIVCLYVADREEVDEGKIQQTLLESPGKPDLRVTSVSSLIRLYELMRASKVSHDEVDKVLFEASVDIDSRVLALDQELPSAPAPGESPGQQKDTAGQPPQQKSAEGTEPAEPASGAREMEQVARMVEEVSRPEKDSEEPVEAATANEQVPEQDQVTRKKEIHLTNLASRQSAAGGAISTESAQTETTASRPEDIAVGFNATLNESSMNAMPDLPQDSWRDSLTSSDEQLFDSISGTRKKPFISMGLGRKNAGKTDRTSSREAGADADADKSPDGIFSGIFSGLGRQSKPAKTRGVSMDSFEQATIEDLIKPDAGPPVERKPELKIPTLDESAPAGKVSTPQKSAEEAKTAADVKRAASDAAKPKSAAGDASRPQIAAEQKATVTPPVFSPGEAGKTATPAHSSKGQPAALEQHAALIRIVCRLWPYPEFRDYAVDVFSCGAKSHDLARADVEELLSLVELHSRRR